MNEQVCKKNGDERAKCLFVVEHAFGLEDVLHFGDQLQPCEDGQNDEGERHKSYAKPNVI